LYEYDHKTTHLLGCADWMPLPVGPGAWARASVGVGAGAGGATDPGAGAPLLLYEKMSQVPAGWKQPGLPDRFWQDSLPDESALFVIMKEKGTILDATLSAYHQWARQDSAMQYD
jgi:hypothetical protein